MRSKKIQASVTDNIVRAIAMLVIFMAFYVTIGIGNTDFAGDERFTFNYGVGYRFLLSDIFTIYSDFRNNVFDMDSFGTEKTTNNLEFTIGLGFIF